MLWVKKLVYPGIKGHVTCKESDLAFAVTTGNLPLVTYIGNLPVTATSTNLESVTMETLGSKTMLNKTFIIRSDFRSKIKTGNDLKRILTQGPC